MHGLMHRSPPTLVRARSQPTPPTAAASTDRPSALSQAHRRDPHDHVIHALINPRERTIVRTGPTGIARIAAPNGESVVTGPNIAVQITRQGFDVIEEPTHYKPLLIRGPGGRYYKVRTGIMVLSARG